jgi:hypothetical protein
MRVSAGPAGKGAIGDLHEGIAAAISSTMKRLSQYGTRMIRSNSRSKKRCSRDEFLTYFINQVIVIPANAHDRSCAGNPSLKLPQSRGLDSRVRGNDMSGSYLYCKDFYLPIHHI